MKSRTRDLVLIAIFSALIIIMTIIPFFGYISYGPIEITTLHIVVIVGGVCLGWKCGAIIGGVWGITCIIRAAALAASSHVFEIFMNPFVSLVPRILVGIVAALVFGLFKNKFKVNGVVSAGIAAACGTFTNTLLVLSAMYIFSNMIKGYADIFELFKKIWFTLIGVNGLIELCAAIIIVPVIYTALSKTRRLN